MPLPKTTNVGRIMSELKRKGKKRPRKQRIAISLDQARRSGKPRPKKTNPVG